MLPTRGNLDFQVPLPAGMVERGGYKIGFIGLLTPETMQISSAGKDVSIDPIEDAGAKLADELK